MERYSFFDAILRNEQYDRVYLSKDYAAYFASFIGNGVFPNPSTNLQVYANSANMVLTIKQGKAWVNGYFYFLDEDMQVRINDADMQFNRKDTIVLQLNLTERWIKNVYKAGEPSNMPVAPGVIRNDDIYELKIAEILVKAGSIKVQQQDITDTRQDANVCGLVTHVVTSIDTTSIYNQFQNYLNNKIAEWDATKRQQGIDWQSQMNQQQQNFNTQHNNIEGWFNGVQAEITKLKGFDFDNWCELKGTTLVTIFNADGSISENINNTGNNLKVAERYTAFSPNGFITVTVKVYKADGATLERQLTNTTTFNGDGSITVTTA